MLAKVTVCPFMDPEHIANCMERGSALIQPVASELLKNVRHAGMGSVADQIDDAHLAIMNAAASELLRSTICIYCDTNSQCHPVTHAI